MEHHFSAFSFVDRITSLEPGKAVEGTYYIPSDLPGFPLSLVSEAVGQLAAWLAMAAVDFRSRPVAGIAARVELLGVARPGQTLTLSAHAESIEEDAVAYDGQATVEGVPIVRLHHCVGPMVALEDFDDARAVRGRFELLRTTGAEPGRFRGLPPIPLEYETNGATPAQSAILQVPATGDFFADHFPRRPVFPGSLLMHSNLELAARFAAQLPGLTPRGSWQPAAIANMKLRAFIPPGEPIRIEVSVEDSGPNPHIAVECRNARRLTGSANVLMTWKEEP